MRRGARGEEIIDNEQAATYYNGTLWRTVILADGTGWCSRSAWSAARHQLSAVRHYREPTQKHCA